MVNCSHIIIWCTVTIIFTNIKCSLQHKIILGWMLSCMKHPRSVQDAQLFSSYATFLQFIQSNQLEQNFRVGTQSGGGAWRPKDPMNSCSEEWIQVRTLNPLSNETYTFLYTTFSQSKRETEASLFLHDSPVE
jgi:hypothetical protein